MKKLSRCPACGYYAFNGVECYDCGYTRFIKVFIILIFLLFIIVSCTPSKKMVMPTDCKPTKPIKHQMVEPYFDPHNKKFMIYHPKTQYDLDKKKMLERTGKI